MGDLDGVGDLPVGSSGVLNPTGVGAAHVVSATSGVLAGEEVFVQVWVRDGGFAAPDDVALSDGLRFPVVP